MTERYSNRLFVFDLAGTLIDQGSKGPVVALQHALTTAGIDVSDDVIRLDMGMSKRDHISKIIREHCPDIWDSLKDKPTWKLDHQWVEPIYDAFEAYLIDNAKTFAKPIRWAPNVLIKLKDYGAKVAITTGYPAPIANAMLYHLSHDHGLDMYDTSTSATDVPMGRPAPYMIFQSMQETRITNTRGVVKVGDTCSDVRAAYNAGVRGIGLTGTGNLSRLQMREAHSMLMRAGAKSTREDLLSLLHALEHLLAGPHV